jgi:hypothetical protein
LALVVAAGVEGQFADEFAGVVEDAAWRRPRPMWWSLLLWRMVMTPVGSMRSRRIR